MKSSAGALHSEIGKNFWYYQAAAVVALTGTYPMVACLNLTARGKRVPVKYRIIGYMEKSFVRWWFLKSAMAAVADFYTQHEVRSPGWTRSLYQSWRKLASVFYTVWDRQVTMDIASLSNRELLRQLSSFEKIYYKVWQESIFLDAFDCEGERILRAELEKFPRSLTDAELHTLTSPDIISSLQEERFGLLSLAQAVHRSPSALQAVRRGKSAAWASAHPSQYRRLLRHAEKYFWIHGDYVRVPKLGVDYFFQALRELVTRPDAISREASEQRRMKKLSSEQLRIAVRHGMSHRLRNVFSFMRLLAAWRDLRKKYNIIANYLLLERYVPEFVRRTGLPRECVLQLYHKEFASALAHPARFRSVLRKRVRGRFVVFRPHAQFDEYFGSGGARLLHAVEKRMAGLHKEIKGFPAYIGIVRGRARIVRTSEDFHKMQKGDILVAPNTRPEYVPIMKKAAGIVTDEGGITSHSAIIARELHTPCIVGCQVATSVLKDGALIEVNATKGTVKKL